MKYFFPSKQVVYLVLVISSVVFCAFGYSSYAAQQKVAETRKDQLILEGLINDYCVRLSIRRELLNYECYANVSLKDIIVYLYPSRDFVSESVVFEEKEKDAIKARIPVDIKNLFLSFVDWKWAKEYRVTIVDRTTR
jgi:hypothetical protein